MVFKKRKNDGIVLNMESFDEYKKGREAIIKARKKEQEKLVKTEGKIHEMEEEMKTLKNLLNKLIEEKV